MNYPMIVMKILYTDIAKLHNTSSYNIESGIRSIIELIWEQKRNEELIKKIFGTYSLDNKPANKEFLLSLYYYIKFCSDRMKMTEKEHIYTCPKCKAPCPFYMEIFTAVMEDTYFKD